MASEELNEIHQEIIESLKHINSMFLLFFGQMKFQNYMLLHLYSDRLLLCHNPLAEYERIKKDALSKIRFVQLKENDDSEKWMQIQASAIEAGENFFAELENVLKEKSKKAH